MEVPSSKKNMKVVKPYAAAALFCSSNHRNGELVLTEYWEIMLCIRKGYYWYHSAMVITKKTKNSFALI